MKNFEGPSREIEGASPNRVPSRNFLKRNAMQFTAGTGTLTHHRYQVHLVATRTSILQAL